MAVQLSSRSRTRASWPVASWGRGTDASITFLVQSHSNQVDIRAPEQKVFSFSGQKKASVSPSTSYCLQVCGFAFLPRHFARRRTDCNGCRFEHWLCNLVQKKPCAMSGRALQRNVMQCHVMSCNAMQRLCCSVMPCHVRPCRVM